MLTFFPGKDIKEWGKKAEVMITSQVRVGPSNEPAPRRVNMFLRGYEFKKAEPITEWGGDVFGDRMLHYTRAYAGQRIGVTLRGVEVDKSDPKHWKGLRNTIDTIGNLGLFTSAAPYLAAAGLATKMAETLLKAINRNDRLTVQRQDLHFDEPNRKILQAGRYLFWSSGPKPQTMKSQYRLTGEGDDRPNLLVDKNSGALYKESPYFVLQVDGKKQKPYEDFEIGARSAELLEKWGDKEAGATIFQTIQELARQVNDAHQLKEVKDLMRDLKKSTAEEDKAKTRKKIKAQTELFSKGNVDLLRELLSPYLEESHNS
jgi:hypothetical protein